MRYWLVITIGIGFILSILPNIYAQENISSPLKQFESGIPVQDIKCKDSFVLIIKINGTPVCVKPTSVTRLLSHGWSTIEKFETIHPILQQNKTNATSVTNETQSYCSKVSDDFKGKQVSELVITPKVISSSGLVKFLCIGMSPNSLKVGDDVFFGVDVQNVSNGPIWIKVGPCFSSLFYTITPEDNVQEYPCDHRVKSAVGMGPVPPNVHGVTSAISGHLGGWYKITKPGMLTVTMNFQSIIIDRNLTDLNNVTNPDDYSMKAKQDFDKWYSTDERVVTDTIQFNVNATQNGTDRNQSVIKQNETSTTITNVTNTISTNEIGNFTDEDLNYLPTPMSCINNTPPPASVSQGYTNLNITGTVSNMSSILHPVPQPAPTVEEVNMMNKLYGTRYPPITVTPIISSTHPALVKIISVGMCPEQLKVGDMTSFSISLKNISDKPLLFHGHNFNSFNLLYTISPQDSVQEIPSCTSPYCGEGADWDAPIFPNEQISLGALSAHQWGAYKIMKPGMLTVTMNLNYSIPKGDLTDLQKNVTVEDYKVRVFMHMEKYGTTQVSDTMQFKVNATQ